MTLSAEVLRKVAARVGQATRVACCLASRRAFAALQTPRLWQHVSVYELDDHALAFMQQMDTRDVYVEVPLVTDVGVLERFIAGLPPRTRQLSLWVKDACVTKAHSIMSCICDLNELEILVVQFSVLRQPMCLAFPSDADLPNLRTVHMTEHGQERHMEVYFDGVRLPALKDVILEVRTSDVMATLRRFPRLSSVCYFGTKETYEDARLEGVRLDGLSLNVLNTTAMGFLQSAVARADHVGAMTLLCFCDVCVEAYLPTRTLYIRAMPSVSQVEFMFHAVRGLEHLSVHPHTIGARTSWTARFSRVGSWYNFLSWLKRARLHVGFEGTVVVDPL